MIVDNKERFINDIKQNEGLLFKIASVYTNTPDDKNDLVQEIIYQLWKSYNSFNHKSNISTWMYRVALNVAINELKLAKKKISTVHIDDQLHNLHDVSISDAEVRWNMVLVQMNKLNLLDKGILLLYLEDNSYEEIAEIVGLTISNIATKLSRIKEKLKTEIAKQL